MWPWEHLAAGYLLYSGGKRLLGLDPPGEFATLGLIIGTQIPDLTDKPLSWGLDVFPSGYALGHSILVAIPVGVLLLVLGSRMESRMPLPFVLGYWSHLVADVLDPLRHGNPPLIGRILWPVVESDPYEQDLGIGRGFHYLQEFGESLASTPLFALLVLYGLLPLGTIALWVADGRPGMGFVNRVRGPKQ